MALTAGTKLGPYEIQSPLGAGGMGEVYRARDTRLDRTVAIKILPSHLSADPDAKQRFDREARTISSLNHPNICTLYDVGHQDGTDYLVMEYLEGETLADRLRKGPMPLPQLYKCGMEVCDGLDRAHRAGIVHRDLKPGNVMLTKGGAKLMDFGLAKASAVSATAASSLTVTLTTPAASHPLTAEGTVVGTFQYMAPEQVEGRESDARSDIFALGAVLYEMATARRAFEGKSAASAMAAILEREPAPISTITPTAPPALDRLVKTCIAKDPDERWQTAHDVKLQLKHIGDGSSITSATALAAPRRKHKTLLPWAVAGICAAIALAAVALSLSRKQEAGQLMRLGIVPPDGMEFNVMGDNSGPAVLSPDGRSIVFSARMPGHVAQLFVRALDSTTSRALPGTEDAHFPFWSPDSRSVAFFGSDKLKRIDLEAGAPVSICDDAIGRGGTWAPDGTIFAALSYNSGISAVPASGGTPTLITKFDTAKYSSHRWPQILPDGKHFLFIAVNHTAPSSPDTAVYWASIDGKENHVVVKSLSTAVYADGYLLYERDRTLMAQPFDVQHGELTGLPQVVRDNVQMDGALWRTNLSASGELLLYASGDAAARQPLTWYDRSGKAIGTVDEGGSAQEVSISPDGKRLALTDVNTVVASVWIYDLATKVKNRLTFTSGVTRSPVWSPDGSQIAFTENQQKGIAIKDAAGGAAAHEVLASPDGSIGAVNSWSRDGRYLLFQQGYGLNLHLKYIDLKGDRTPVTYGDPDSYNFFGDMSPDGRWVAYVAINGAMPQLFVAPFPWTGEKWQVSPAYGIEPRWRADGKELYYYDSTGMVAVPVDGSGKAFHIENGKMLFSFSLPGLDDEYDVTRDGQKFVAVTQTGGSTQPLTLVQNWTAQLNKK